MEVRCRCGGVGEEKWCKEERGRSVREVINDGRCVEKVKHQQPNCRLTVLAADLILYIH